MMYRINFEFVREKLIFPNCIIIVLNDYGEISIEVLYY